jgi:hypothetical protein
MLNNTSTFNASRVVSIIPDNGSAQGLLGQTLIVKKSLVLPFANR